MIIPHPTEVIFIEQLLNHILEELKSIKSEQQATNLRLDRIDAEQQAANLRLDRIDAEQQAANLRLDRIDAELINFRQEMHTDLQILKGGQVSIREQVNHRAKEIKDHVTKSELKLTTEMNDLKLDVEFTYEKISRNELALKKLRANQP